MKANLIGDVYEYEELVNTIESTEEPIELLVNSVGGDVFAGLQIINAIQKHGNVTANVEVLSASISACITLACKKFTIGKNDLMLLHNCWTWSMGNKEELRQEADTMEKIDAILHNIILENCTEPEKIEGMMNEGDVFLTGEEVASLFTNCELVERGKQEGYAASGMPSIINAIKGKATKEEPKASLTLEDLTNALTTFKAEIIDACKPKEDSCEETEEEKEEPKDEEQPQEETEEKKEPYVMSDELKELMEFDE